MSRVRASPRLRRCASRRWPIEADTRVTAGRAIDSIATAVTAFVTSLVPILVRFTLSTNIFAGLALGTLAGLFFGDDTSVLQPVAEVYVRLMQMTVLPYLVLALVIGFGQLDPGNARRLAARAALLLLATWMGCFALLIATPSAFPGVQTAAFFSNALVDPPQPFSVPDLYFTSNPFNSLANATVPAVVLFSTLVGIGLMRTRHRDRLLEPLRVANAAIVEVTRFITMLTPIGVFAIVAVTAGTMRLSTIASLEVYFVSFICASLLLAFVMLPLMATSVTPFRYREIVSISKSALLTAFVTNNAFLVLPIIAANTKQLLNRHNLLGTESDTATEILIPVLFNFPNAGRLLTLLFVPFAGWLAGSPFSPRDLVALFAVGVPSYFAKAQVALPFLLDAFQLPHDLFQLYIPTTIITGKFDSMVTAMNLLVFALIGGTAMHGAVRLQRRRLIVSGLVTFAAITVSVIGIRVLLPNLIDTTYRRDQVLLDMRGTIPAPARVLDRRSAPPPRTGAARRGLELARARGTLRVGYDRQNVPLSFINSRGELVGFDVELSVQLARSLGLDAEFVPVDWGQLPAMLESGEIDVMPSVWVRPYWFGRLQLSDPYFTGTIGVVVRDERRQEFAQLEALRRRTDLTVGVPLDSSQLAASMAHYFHPGTDFVRFESPAEYFAREQAEIDAYLMPVEAGAAATLLHPQFTVVVPQPHPIRLPYAFGVAMDAHDVRNAINEWIVYAASEGTMERTYNYWILGEGAEDHAPRWSIVRNVLHWK